ncbi:hypothetical protein DABAL43B_1348 [Psychrobacter sp. DAB_AL43B]|nr:hypothetical protein DABAL43B_1348 [Psychrobacter sp. DAB_AL43B]
MMVVLLTLALVGYKILQPKNSTSNSTTDVTTDTSTEVAFTSTDFDDIDIPPTYVDSGSDPNSTSVSAVKPTLAPQPAALSFSCDGRKHCSQMTSCAEATYFIQHCSNTKMDGNNDGIPCEKQWCN